MATKSVVQGVKGKGFSFRITEKLSDELAEVKAKCLQHGLRVNVSEALSAALEREVKALQKRIQESDPSWMPGQLTLPAVEEKPKKPRAPRKPAQPKV